MLPGGAGTLLLLPDLLSVEERASLPCVPCCRLLTKNVPNATDARNAQGYDNDYTFELTDQF